MSDCCSASSTVGNAPKRYRCPINGKEYPAVSTTTILHHIKQPWSWNEKQQGYYFCDDPECDVVYFGQDSSIINSSALRTPVGIKQRSKISTVCYCFGITKSDAISNPHVKEFVIKKTKEHSCACGIRNPSGKCCLKDFP